MSCIPWLSRAFTCIRQNIKLSSSHALFYGFIVFMFVSLILRKEKKHFRENWLIFWGIWGEVDLFLGIWGAKAKYFSGAKENYFQGFGEINALFAGIKGAQTPWGPQQSVRVIYLPPTTFKLLKSKLKHIN